MNAVARQQLHVVMMIYAVDVAFAERVMGQPAGYDNFRGYDVSTSYLVSRITYLDRIFNFASRPSPVKPNNSLDMDTLPYRSGLARFTAYNARRVHYLFLKYTK